MMSRNLIHPDFMVKFEPWGKIISVVLYIVDDVSHTHTEQSRDINML